MYTAMGFTVTLTNNADGNITSIMTYTSSSIPPNGLLVVSCDIPTTNTTQTENTVITLKGVFVHVMHVRWYLIYSVLK